MKAITLFLLVTFPMYVGCSTTRAYQVNVDDKASSALLGEKIRVHHRLKDSPTPIEGVVGRSPAKTLVVIHDAKTTEIPYGDILKVEIFERKIDKNRTFLAIAGGTAIIVFVARALVAYGALAFYDSF